MKQTTTNRMELNRAVKSFRKNVAGLIVILTLGVTSLTFAQHARPGVIKPSADVPASAEKNPGAGPVKGNTIVSPSLCPAITSLTMLDMGFDKAILTWSTTAVFDSIIFRFAPSGSPNPRTVAIPGNPNPERYYLMGLLSQTTYDIEVSTVCSNGVQSNWSSPLTVTTLPEPAPRLSNAGNTNLLLVNPNPATTVTTISFMASSNVPQNMSIVASNGRIMYSRQIIPSTDKVQITVDVTAYPPGVYMVRTNNNTNVSIERFIKL